MRAIYRSTMSVRRSRLRTMTVAPTVAVLVCGAVAAVTTTVAQARAATPQSYQFVDLGKSFSPNYENQAEVVVGAVNPRETAAPPACGATAR